MGELPLTALFTKTHALAPLDGPELEAQLMRVVEAARTAWPTITLTLEEFIPWLAERVGSASDVAKLHGADLYLACACTKGDRAALAQLDERYLGRLALYLRRFNEPSEFVEEVRQRLRERCLVGPEPRIAQYKGDGPLDSWIRVAALRIAVDLKRSRDVDQRKHQGAAHELPLPSDPELEIIKRRYGPVVEAALREALEKLAAEPRYFLRMHYVDGVGLDKIAGLHRVSKATASRWLSAARQELMAETRQIVSQRLGIDGESLESLIGAVVSRLDLTLSPLAKR
jgi:RNA polymerase sigma-70 factor (ECF subfamily)